MKLISNRLGELNIDEKLIFHFPEGIPGFENEKEFAILPLDSKAPFYYMHSVGNPDLCLVLAVPFAFFPEYEVELPAQELENLEARQGTENLAILTVLTIPEEFNQATANLLAPVVVNTISRKGIQYVPARSEYTTRHPIFNEPARKKSSAR